MGKEQLSISSQHHRTAYNTKLTPETFACFSIINQIFFMFLNQSAVVPHAFSPRLDNALLLRLDKASLSNGVNLTGQGQKITEREGKGQGNFRGLED